MNDWNRWDVLFTVGPFIILAGIAVCAIRRARKAGL